MEIEPLKVDNEVILAAKAGVDNTYVHIDETGIKICKFVENCKPLGDIYCHDLEFMKELARKIRQLHNQGLEDWQEFRYNPMEECEKFMLEASRLKGNLFHIFQKEWDAMRRLYVYAERDGMQRPCADPDRCGTPRDLKDPPSGSAWHCRCR